MATAKTRKLKFIAPRTRCIIDGYLRSLSSSIGYDKTLQIPMLILYWCCLYFFPGDTFAKGRGIKINDIHNIAKINGGNFSYKNINGTLQINKDNFDNCICIWKIKLIQAGAIATDIGISNDIDSKPRMFYCLKDNGCITGLSHVYSGFRINQIVSVILDVEKGTIAFKVGDNKQTSDPQRIPFDDDESYHLSIGGSKITVQLVSFQVVCKE